MIITLLFIFIVYKIIKSVIGATVDIGSSIVKEIENYEEKKTENNEVKEYEDDNKTRRDVEERIQSNSRISKN